MTTQKHKKRLGKKAHKRYQIFWRKKKKKKKKVLGRCQNSTEEDKKGSNIIGNIIKTFAKIKNKS